jgi:hypothetical protein
MPKYLSIKETGPYFFIISCSEKSINKWHTIQEFIQKIGGDEDNFVYNNLHQAINKFKTYERAWDIGSTIWIYFIDSQNGYKLAETSKYGKEKDILNEAKEKGASILHDLENKSPLLSYTNYLLQLGSPISSSTDLVGFEKNDNIISKDQYEHMDHKKVGKPIFFKITNGMII